MSEANLFDGLATNANEPSKIEEIDSKQAVESHSGAEEAKGSVAAPEASSTAIKEGDKATTIGAASPSIVKITDNMEPASFIEARADLIVGATGSGKTVNVGRVSDYVLKKYGKLTRLAGMADNTGPISGLIKSKQVDYWPMFIWKNHIDIIKKACQGWWPLRPYDPESPIVAPDVGTYEVYGFMAYEGLTGFGDAILNSLGDDQAKLSQSPSYIWTQGDSTFSGGNESYYGFMQKELNRFVQYTNLLPFERILWTALEAKGDDQGNKVYGPMIGGKKAIAKAGAWFCNFVHMDILAGEVVKNAGGTGQELVKARHVLFLKTHIDPLNMIPFPCKVRPPIEYVNEIPDFLESGNLAEAYELLDKLYAKQEKDSIKKISEIEGLRDKLLERAQKAVKAEQEAREKRAKAAKLLKPMVTVPAIPAASVTGTAAKSAIPGSPAPRPAIPGAVRIQPAGKK